MKRPYKVRIRCEYVIESEVDAHSEEEAKQLVLEGKDRNREKTYIDVELLECEEVTHDRITEN
jgi:hypothetical protein